MNEQEPNGLDSAKGVLIAAFQMGRRMAVAEIFEATSPFNDPDLTYAWEKGFHSHFYNQGLIAGQLGVTVLPHAYDKWPLVEEAWMEGCAGGRKIERRRRFMSRTFKKKDSSKTHVVWSRDGF